MPGSRERNSSHYLDVCRLRTDRSTVRAFSVTFAGSAATLDAPIRAHDYRAYPTDQRITVGGKPTAPSCLERSSQGRVSK